MQSYAVTGDEMYYDNYFKELNEDKNCAIALAGLEENDITEEEWAQSKILQTRRICFHSMQQLRQPEQEKQEETAAVSQQQNAQVNSMVQLLEQFRI